MKILYIALKDMLRSARSMFALGMMLIAPLLVTGLIYFAFSGLASGDSNQLADFRVVVVNRDQPPANAPALGEMMVDFLQDERMPDWLVVIKATNESDALEQVNRQQAGAAVLLPADFSQALLDPQGSAQLRLVHDPAASLGPQVLSSLIGQFIDGVSGTRILINTIQQSGNNDPQAFATASSQYAAWFTETQNSIHHSADPVIRFRSPGAANTTNTDPLEGMFGKIMSGMLIFFVFFTGANGAQSILSEEEEGTLARLFSTPILRGQVLAGKFLAIWLMILVQSAVLLVVSSLVFGIQWGEPGGLVLVVIGLSFSATGFGILLISLVKNTRQAGALIGGGLTAFGMLGGLFTTGIANLPSAFETVNLFTPHGWALRGLKILLADGSTSEVLVPVLALAGMGLAFFLAGMMKFRRRLAVA